MTGYGLPIVFNHKVFNSSPSGRATYLKVARLDGLPKNVLQSFSICEHSVIL